MDQCPKCKEQGPMVEKSQISIDIHGKKIVELFCNICGHSWKVAETIE